MTLSSQDEAGQSTARHESVADFIGLSSVLTGFSTAELEGTGLVECYYNVVLRIIGERIFGRLLLTWSELKKGRDELAELEDAVDREIMSSALMGPVARNILSMWYVGNWNQMPRVWRNHYGAAATDVTHVVSAEAYQQGLMWRAIFAHPPAAKQPGFASWTAPPEGGEEIDDMWSAPRTESNRKDTA